MEQFLPDVLAAIVAGSETSMHFLKIFFPTVMATTLFIVAAGAASPMQPLFISSQCPTGGPEAEKLFQLGVDYHKARKGRPYNLKTAEKFYNEAMKMGNAKAAINLGLMYRQNDPNETEGLNYIERFEWAADQGCPEGFFALAEACDMGWGVPRNPEKAKRLMQKAAEEGCLAAMAQHGERLYREGKKEEGKQWVQKSLELGNGDAGAVLSLIYHAERNSEKMIESLRSGGRLGSRGCINDLADIYYNGDYGQKKDEQYAQKMISLFESIDDKEYPQPIPDFDELIPPKPVEPYAK
jgi:TPR repeat protein